MLQEDKSAFKVFLPVVGVPRFVNYIWADSFEATQQEKAPEEPENV